MIYDCFPFFNELDLLEIRLNILTDVVDKFVIVEATKTHTGQPKPLFFKDNKERFSSFADKIIHVIVDSFPQIESAWTLENYQRNKIFDGLHGANDDDIILLSDLDEIPNPQKVLKFAERPGRYVFRQTTYSYFLNCRRVLVNHWHYGKASAWEGTQMMTYYDFKHCYDGIDCHDYPFLRPSVNLGTTPSKIRFLRDVPFISISNGGWHFTTLGGVPTLVSKLKAYAHQEKKYLLSCSPNTLHEMISHGVDPLSEQPLFVCRIDSSYPEYIRCNLDKYKSYICPRDKVPLTYFLRYGLCYAVAFLIDAKNKSLHGTFCLLRHLKKKLTTSFNVIKN